MESNHIMVKQKLGFFDILRQPLNLTYKNTHFILLTFLSSLPLFCFLLYYELLLQKTLVRISEFVRHQHLDSFGYDWQTLLHTATRTIVIFSNNLIQLGILYLVPFHLLELCSVYATVDSASKSHRPEQKPTIRAGLRGTVVTSIWVLFFSTCTLLGSTWLASIYYVILRNLGGKYNMYFGVFYRAACMALLAKYLEWSTIWNMAIVISVLEDKHGANALMLSASLIRSSERRQHQGLVISLVFSVFGLGLRASCLFFACCGRRNGVVAHAGVFCIVNVMKWVVFVVYFNNCKRQSLGRKGGDEAFGDNGLRNAKTAYEVRVPPDDGLDVRTC
ncbi:hypothetical protein D8674_016359 [Pyrus ussuriensis x Pyrus communis]|uniref:Uncharacterized protein n=1 Tax=Pyrus ussuriensis x Pyrus communis TaxID=2448454 RepID=A0A5N5H9L4_9ROSA|nr:hypothetical protein D8674_016359 [Pyrus ussuriensis x Pyrus communis]